MSNIEDVIEEVESCEKKLTAWEIDFIKSVRDQFSSRGTLTERQTEKLFQIRDEAKDRP